MTQTKIRVVVFSPSIVSTIENPQAATVRAMCQALIDLGCDVTHLEERGNAWYRAMLETDGSAPLRQFNLDFPLVRYRFYDLLRGMERSVWFGRELSTADLCVVYPGSPDEVTEEIAGFAVPQVVRVWDSPDCDLPEARRWLFAPIEADADKRAAQVIAAVDAELSRRLTSS